MQWQQQGHAQQSQQLAQRHWEEFMQWKRQQQAPTQQRQLHSEHQAHMQQRHRQAEFQERQQQADMEEEEDYVDHSVGCENLTPLHKYYHYTYSYHRTMDFLYPDEVFCRERWEINIKRLHALYFPGFPPMTLTTGPDIQLIPLYEHKAL